MKFLWCVGDIVHGFERDAVGEGGVAEDTDHVFLASPLIAGGAHAEGRAQCGAGVARPVAVVFAFRPQGESIQTIGGADGAESVLSAGEDLVDVDLMAHVPHEFVGGGFEAAMQGDSQFDDPQVRPQMAAVLGESVDQFLSDIGCEFRELVHGQLLDVRGVIHHFEITTHCQFQRVRKCSVLRGGTAAEHWRGLRVRFENSIFVGNRHRL
jgi:hypothetical protein